jgi:uncharacterized protein YuzE
MITTTYDPEADALYVYLAPRDAKALDTREVAPGVLLDFDARGQVIGIEVLSVRARDGAGPAAEAAE